MLYICKMKRLIPVVVAILLALAMGACHSSRHTVRGDRGHRSRPDITAVETPRGSGSHHQPSRDASRVIEEARRWLGVPYRYGGNDRGGIDCSGLVCAVFVRALEIKLPRSSREQAGWCRSIRRSDLRPGDLVFFTSRAGGNGNISHVAIYIGNNSIIHSTSSRGVIISDLDENYWRTHFKCCGRVNGIKI